MSGTGTRWCSPCDFEYRPGYTHCTECGRELVAERPPEEPAPPRRVWARLTVTALDGAARERLVSSLQARGIPNRFEADELVVLDKHEWAARTELAELEHGEDHGETLRRSTVAEVARSLRVRDG